MIYILAPQAYQNFVGCPSGLTYISDINKIIYLSNNSVSDQTYLLTAGCQLLSPISQLGPVPATGGNVDAVTTAALPACTYANGALGVGATLTANANEPSPQWTGSRRF